MVESSKHYQTRKWYSGHFNMHFVDKIDNPLKKREEFAVSLRKAKKKEILESKRKNLANILKLNGYSEQNGLTGEVENMESSSMTEENG